MVVLELLEMIDQTEHFCDLGMQKSTVSRLVSSGRNSWIELFSRKRLRCIYQLILPHGRAIVRPSLRETSLHLCMISKVKCLTKAIYAHRANDIIENFTIPLINSLYQTVPTRNPRNHIANLFAFILQGSGPADQSHGISWMDIRVLLTFHLLLCCSSAAEANWTLLWSLRKVSQSRQSTLQVHDRGW